MSSIPRRYINRFYVGDSVDAMREIPERYTNKFYVGDNIDVMSRLPYESIDMVYMDPPFFTQKKRIKHSSEYSYDDFKYADISEYGRYMGEVIQQAYCLLNMSGSLYLHISVSMMFLIEDLLIESFGRENRIGCIFVKRAGIRNDGKFFPTTFDCILVYSKDIKKVVFNKIYTPLSLSKIINSRYKQRDSHGLFRPSQLYVSSQLGGGYRYKVNGIDRLWLCKKSTMKNLYNSGRLYFAKSGMPYRKLYLDEHKGEPLTDDWGAFRAKNVVYPTQKSLDLLLQIVKTGSNPDSLIMDPFAGSGTTLIAANHLGRRFIGIDRNHEAHKAYKERFRGILGGTRWLK